ncbi:hypothetical protein [Marinobacter shengliensis]|uniref:hypothetical protein n=1 Tax=Marinobacter shengliensis TaxID=1389223 RepID=UPI001E5EC84B|nr:hypothetical protein [Marinobacter shengliensis]MCD1628479.1 hypothetical protein [Marinobacter shengliensis]
MLDWWIELPARYNDAIVIVLGMLITIAFVGIAERRQLRKERLQHEQKMLHKSVLDAKSRIYH